MGNISLQVSKVELESVFGDMNSLLDTVQRIPAKRRSMLWCPLPLTTLLLLLQLLAIVMIDFFFQQSRPLLFLFLKNPFRDYLVHFFYHTFKPHVSVLLSPYFLISPVASVFLLLERLAAFLEVEYEGPGGQETFLLEGQNSNLMVDRGSKANIYCVKTQNGTVWKH